jgi:hypothetical protein
MRAHDVESAVDTDDPRWVAHLRELDTIFDAKMKRAWDLVDTQPTTLAGIAALLRYADEFEAAGNDCRAGPRLPLLGEGESR